MTIDVGIVGLGRWGKIRSRAYKTNPDVNLCSVYDIEPDREETAKSLGCRFYTNLEEMLRKEKLDLVNVSVPASKHADVAYSCLEAGVNVLVEKPMATTLDGAIKLADKARENNLVLTVGYTERFSPTTLEVREIFLNGYIGYLISMDAKKRVASVHRAMDVGVILDVAIHPIYKMINFHKKGVVETYAIARRIVSKGHEDYAKILLTFEDGVTGYIEADRTRSIREQEFELNGSRGSCKENTSDTNWGNHYLEFNKGFVEEISAFNFRDLEEYFNKFGSQKTEKKVIRPINPIEPAKLEVDQLIDALVNKHLPPVSLEEALRSTKIALSALESAEKHTLVSLENNKDI